MAKVSELLENLAKKLEDPNSEIVLGSEHDEHMLNIVTFALVRAASIIKEAAHEVLKFEPSIDAEDLEELALVANDLDNDVDLSKYSDSVDNLLNIMSEKNNLIEDLDNAAKLAAVLDNSGDSKLAKVASVLDEILLTIGAPKNLIKNIKSAEESEIEKLRVKYKTPSSDFFTLGNEKKDKLTEEYTKDIEDNIKKYKPMEHALNTRYCPEHPGISLIRIGDGTWQCSLDKKIYDFPAGYKLMDGSSVPGTSVSNQTQNLADHAPEHVSFSSRQDKLNNNG